MHIDTHTEGVSVCRQPSVSLRAPSSTPTRAVAGLKRRGRTGAVETDGDWHQLKPDTNGPRRDGEETAPSGPDAAQAAAGKNTDLKTMKRPVGEAPSGRRNRSVLLI